MKAIRCFPKLLTKCAIAGVLSMQVAADPCGSTEPDARSDELESRLNSLEDQRQIDQVFARFARGFDRQDKELITSVFWPNAQANYGKFGALLTRDQFIGIVLPALGQLGSYAHHITNMSVDIAGDVAHVEAYVLFVERSKDDKSGQIVAGRYIDKLERHGGEWRISVHEFIPHFAADARSAFDRVYPAALYPRSDCWLGTRNKFDPSYQRPLSPRPNTEVGPACAK
jgi:hypothetical protein